MYFFIYRGGVFIKIFVGLSSQDNKTQMIEKCAEKESQTKFTVIVTHCRIYSVSVYSEHFFLVTDFPSFSLVCHSAA